MANADEFTHLIKLLAAQQETGYPQAAKGYIANYDPNLHRVRVVIPMLRGDDDTPVLTPWIPLGTPIASNGWGVQWIPKGGATFENPTSGEQVMVGFFDKNIGVAAVPCMFFSETQPPPATKMPSNDLMAPGDQVMMSPQGSYVHFLANGDVTVVASNPGKVSVTSYGDTAVTTTNGNVDITASNGIITMTDKSGTSCSLGGNGYMTLTGTLEVTGDVLVGPAGSQVSSLNHKHNLVQIGTSDSGPPVPGT